MASSFSRLELGSFNKRISLERAFLSRYLSISCCCCKNSLSFSTSTSFDFLTKVYVGELRCNLLYSSVYNGNDDNDNNNDEWLSLISSKKNHGNIPKRIHKAEREKMKREHSNDLFLALANSLELSDQNSSKASVLIEANRAVKDMLVQIQCLRKQNAALLSESQYVTVEKSELKDENTALEAEIDKLRTKIKSEGSKFQLDLNMAPPEYHYQEH
ncbi:basic helix-loop-helix DNA-binding superfamily protein [Perilla frutescens var. hirtella]|nr:basic helix-loop-helix DNA-binding superfamily protein [Perilla frutescens var. hirtella]